jgi:hypothetical protein
MAVSSSRSPGRGIWPLLGYAALGGIALAKQNYRPSDRSPLADRGQPETGAMGTTRSTDEPRQVPVGATIGAIIVLAIWGFFARRTGQSV